MNNNIDTEITGQGTTSTRYLYRGAYTPPVSILISLFKAML